MYGYGGYYGSDPLTSMFGNMFSGAVAVSVIMILGFLVTVGLCILFYIMFLGKKSDRRHGWGKFFHFEHFYIEQILRVLYLISAVSTATFTLCMIICSLFGGVGAFFGALIAGVIICAIMEFLLRIMYEWVLISIRQAVDVRALRWKIVGDVADPSTSEGSIGSLKDSINRGKQVVMPNQQSAANAYQQPAQPGAYSAPAQQAPKAQQAQPTQAPSNDSWYCSSCGHQNTGMFCASCGKRK